MEHLNQLKFCILSFGVLGLLAFTPLDVNTYQKDFFTSIQPETYVYLCNGPSSKSYHYKDNCTGLNRCSTDLERTTLAEARRRGRTLCGWED